MPKEERKRRRLTDEDIIQALLSAGSVEGACKELNCHYMTLYKRTRQESFKQLYREVKADLIRQVTTKLQCAMACAVDTLLDVMQDTEASGQTRVYAATSILQYGAKFTEASDILERLEALEASQENLIAL